MQILRSALFLAIVCACGACKPDHTTPGPGRRRPPPSRRRRRRPPASTWPASTSRASRATTSTATPTARGATRPTIPEDRSSTGVGFEVFQKAEKRNAELIQGLAAAKPAAGHRRPPHRRLLRRLHGPGRHREARARAAAARARQDRRDRQTRTDLARVLGEGLRADVDPLNATNFATEQLFGVFVAQGLEDPAHNVAYLLQGGLGMPNRDYYLSPTRRWSRSATSTRPTSPTLLKLAGIADADAKAAAIYELERRSPRRTAAIVETEDVHKANNPWPIADFAKKAPGHRLDDVLQGRGPRRASRSSSPGSRARSPSSPRWSQSEPLQTWKDWLAFHAHQPRCRACCRRPSTTCVRLLRHHAERHAEAARSLEARASASTNDALGDAVGKLYVEQYFPPSSQGAGAADGRQHRRRVRRAHRQARLDERRRRRPRRRRRSRRCKVGVGYPGHLARLRGAGDPPRRRAGQRRARASSSSTSISSPSSASRSTATSGG